MEPTYYSIMDSPIGPLTLRWCDGALVGLGFGDTARRAVRDRAQRDDARLERARTQLGEYFRGERDAFELPLRFAGTPFQQRVWCALADIAFGHTQSYGELAQRIGEPRWPGARDVGTAAGQNPLAIVLPCHRVIGSDGSLTGFGGGLPRKRWLLDHEARVAPAPALGQINMPWLEAQRTARSRG
jgi:methylated-DNA-[protein]-cysteine S-methyltransferase